MNKSICIWFTIGGILILLGAVLFCLTAYSAGFNFGNIFGSATEEITLVITDDFEGISIDTTTADIDFCLTDDGSCKVVATDEKGINYSANVEDGVLKISSKNDRKWYEKIFNIGFISSLTVYLPEAEYESLVINELTGNINVPAYLHFGSADIKLSTGKLNYYAETLGSINVVGSTGDVSIKCRCTGAVDVNISTGNLLLNGIESAADINVKVSTGDVKIVNSVCNSMNIYGTTGDFEVQSVTVTENVSIKNSTGKTNCRSDHQRSGQNCSECGEGDHCRHKGAGCCHCRRRLGVSSGGCGGMFDWPVRWLQLRYFPLQRGYRQFPDHAGGGEGDQ